MKPPSEDATMKALAIMIDSIRQENGADFKSRYVAPTNRPPVATAESTTHRIVDQNSCSYPLISIPPQQLATNADALTMARSHLYKEANKLIARVQHHQNLAAPIHQLPQEVFEIILEMSDEYHDLRWLFSLLQVGRLWYTTIINRPQLWTRMESSYPAKVARLIIKRSKSSPTLSFRWHWAHPRSEKTGKEILEMAVANSARFKSMEIELRQEDSFDSIRRLLDAPTTALESLRLQADKYGHVQSGDGLGRFVLSEGAPLLHLDLHHVSLNYDSPRFSGLVTLRLDKSALPVSVEVLVRMLSIASHLEHLELSRPTRMRRVEQGVWPPPRLINLPCLTYFTMSDIPRSYCAALLSSIYAPTPRCYIEVEDKSFNDSVEQLDAILWQPGSSQMAALLGANDDSDSSRVVAVTANNREVIVRVDDRGYYGRRTFTFQRPGGSTLVKLIGEYVHHVPMSFELVLALFNPMVQHGPLDLTPWSNHLMSLMISYPIASLSALEQLGYRTVPSGTGTAAMEDWLCPSLLYISLNMIPTDEVERRTNVSALLSLIKKRWSGEDGLPPAIQPKNFEIVCSHSAHPHLQEVEAKVQKTVWKRHKLFV
ncbi:hypothetical protein FRC01_012055 [Tulasnella sp. 417]|nr:hypothetical protein FRC01_012055 [Tulasnella sp. 417]